MEKESGEDMWNKNILENDDGVCAKVLNYIEISGQDVSRMPASCTPRWLLLLSLLLLLLLITYFLLQQV